MLAWLQLVAPIVAIVGAALWLERRLGRLDRRLEHIELRIGTVESQNRALLKAFPQLVSSLMATRLTPEQGTQLIATAPEAPPISEILSKIQPTPNPLPLEDVFR